MGGPRVARVGLNEGFCGHDELATFLRGGYGIVCERR